MPPESSSTHLLPSLPRSQKCSLTIELPIQIHENEASGDASTDSSASSSLPKISRNLNSSPLPRSLSWRYNLFAPVEAFHKLKQAREEVSLLTPSSPPSVPAGGLSLPLLGEVRWDILKAALKEWLKNPKNLALLLWGSAVGVSGALLFLVMVGFLDEQLPYKRDRDAWFEVNNQVLNALFTMMCLYLHPQRCLHLVMLLRWEQQDITKLREVYCKNGTYRPHEWAHMLVVVVLLHINCFAQYALCGLNWGFRRSQRPAVGVGLCLAVAIGAPAAAGIYNMLSPLGKDFQVDEEDELHLQEIAFAQKGKLEHTPSLRISRAKFCCGELAFDTRHGALVSQPEWKGGLFNCCDDPPVAVLSTACGFCVFGWNMERLGFGNRYVHIVTFILLCTAPFWIFNLAAINIDNSRVRRGLGVSGILLSFFGLLYGGFWRIHMRKTYGLPAQKWCFGKAILTDCTQWLFCAPCSLSQEVRTSEYYKIQDGKFFERKALSELSSEPSPSSDWASPGAYPLIPEASSPMSARTSFHGPFIVSPGLKSKLLENRMVVANGDPMQPPITQVVHDKSMS